MRVDPLLDPGFLRRESDRLLDPALGDRGIAAIGPLAERHQEMIPPLGVAAGDVAAKTAHQSGGDRHHAVPAPLAPDLEGELAALRLPDVLNTEAEQLPEAEPAVGEEAEYQLVPLGLDRILHVLDLLAGEDVDHPPLCLGESWGGPHRGATAVSLRHPSKEHPDRPDVGADRRPTERTALAARVEQLGGKAADKLAGELCGRADPFPGAPGEELRTDRILVCLDGASRQATGVAVGEEVVAEGGEG